MVFLELLFPEAAHAIVDGLFTCSQIGSSNWSQYIKKHMTCDWENFEGQKKKLEEKNRTDVNKTIYMCVKFSNSKINFSKK